MVGNPWGWLFGGDEEYYGYTLRGPRGGINYVGVTKDPRRRAAQHYADGRRGQLETEGRFSSLEEARHWETHALAEYRESHGGRNPRYNHSRTGGWPF